MPNRFSKVDAQQVALLGGNAKMASDPKRNQTVLHLSTLGAIRGEQNNTFVDDSPNRYTITRTGNVAPSTFSPYGDSWSNYFDGNGDWLSVPNTSTALATNDFTIEAWIYPNSLPTGTNTDTAAAAIISKQAQFLLYYDSSGRIEFVYRNSANNSWNVYSAAQTNIAVRTWNHIVVTRSGSTLKIFLNGTTIYSGSWISTTYTNANPITVGRGMDSGYSFYLDGYISNLRLIIGTALYTTDFTPSKTPLTAVSGTSLLTCASNRFRDLSSNNFAITPAGNVAVKTASPFPQTREFKKPQRGWCVPFNGSTQRLETPAASVANGLQLGTSDFTIECWVKAKPNSNYAKVMDSCAYGNPNYAFTIGTPAAGASTDLVFSTYTGATVNYLQVNFPNVLNNSWNHIAVVRSSNVLRSYVNGELISTLAMPVVNQNLNYTTPIVLGAARSSSAATYANYFSGKISNVMIVKKALYSGNFVPMQSPRTADQNGTLPVLLTCQGGTVMDYSYSSQTLTSAGSLVVDSDGPFDQDDELSYYFDGNGDYLSIADNAALELGSGDFTIECWFNSAVAAKASVNSDGSYHVSIARKPWAYDFVVLGTASGMTGFAFNGFVSTTGHLRTMNYSFAANTWYHVAVTRQSGVLRLFVNGEKGYQDDAYTHTLNNNANALYIGGGGSGVEYSTNGYISNLRLVTGAALYTASFTPSRKPLPIASSGSTALLTCRGRTAADQSNNNLTVTANGNAGVASLSPFRSLDYNGMSCYFGGNGDFFTVAPGASTDITATDFTVSHWVYPTLTGVRQDIFSQRPSSGGSNGWILGLAANGTYAFTHAGGASVATPSAIPINCWTHLAVVRSGTNIKIFQNGIIVTNGTITNGGATTATLYISRNAQGANYYYQGLLSDVRIVKGVPLYTANFTPPTIPALSVPSTQFLINAYPAIYDTTRKNAIETVGSYNGANGGPPWGTRAERYSFYFNGTNDYLNIPNSPDFDLGTGDFTIETWVYISANSATDSGGGKTAAIISCYASSTQGWMLNIGGNATTTGIGLWLETHNAGTYVNTATPAISISQTTWHHITVTRSSGIVRFFLNGTQQGSNSTFTTSLSSGGGQVLIGGTSYSGYPRYLNGHLHDLRVTKGFARYTSNFTLPKLPLPIK